MHGGGGVDSHVADAYLVADVDLAHVREATHQRAGAHRHDDRRVLSEPPQRRPVEVVEVDVRDESGVDPFELGTIERYAPSEVPHPGANDGVGQQANPVQLDQYGRVPDVEEPARRNVHCLDPLTTAVLRLHPISVIETPSQSAIRGTCE